WASARFLPDGSDIPTAHAIRAGASWAPAFHASALALAFSMSCYYASRLLPVATACVHEEAWCALSYLLGASVVIMAYWPPAAYRMLLLLASPFVSKLGRYSVPQLPRRALPPVCIVVPIRNERITTVLPLLRSLIELRYPAYEIVIADNSDIEI